jgi:alkylated DNA repair dioxygenase AlkB
MNAPDPRYEYIHPYLSATEAAEIIAHLDATPHFIMETGQCDRPPMHATVQWGPRQSYTPCVPQEFRVKSSGDIPDFLVPLKMQLEKKYDCYFDSVQVNKHFNHNAKVNAHTDSPPGYICMVSLGAERDFRLAHRGTYKPLASIRMASGSLLTFFPKDQWRMSHAMPRSTTPCGVRYALVFRYITEALTREGSIGKVTTPEAKRERANRKAIMKAEYDAVQTAYRSGGYSAVADCLQLRPWTQPSEGAA